MLSPSVAGLKDAGGLVAVVTTGISFMARRRQSSWRSARRSPEHWYSSIVGDTINPQLISSSTHIGGVWWTTILTNNLNRTLFIQFCKNKNKQSNGWRWSQCVMGVDFKHSVVDIQVTRSMYDVVMDMWCTCDHRLVFHYYSDRLFWLVFGFLWTFLGHSCTQDASVAYVMYLFVFYSALNCQ